MQVSLNKLPLAVAAALLTVVLTLTAGCTLAADEGSPELETAAVMLEAAAFPTPRSLASVGNSTGPRFAAAAVLTNEGGSALHSADAVLDDDGLRMVSTFDDTGWAVYSATWPDEMTQPDCLHLKLTRRAGTGWLGLADFQRGTWQWQELPDGDEVDVYLGTELSMRNSAVLLTLVVHDGSALTFVEGALSNSQSPEPIPEPEPEPVRPAVRGAYISLGYWSPEEIDATFASLEEIGVNLVLDYALYLPDDPEWEAALQYYFDSAEEHGIGVAYWLGRPLEGMTPLTTNGHFTAAVAEVAALKHQPAISAWYVHDEILPMIAGSDGTNKYSLSLAQMQELYAAVRSEDPTRPQLNVWNYLPDHELFSLVYGDDNTPWGRPDWMGDPVLYEQTMQAMIQSTCDWVMIDMYPVGAPWRGPDACPPELAVSTLTQRAADLRDADQPLVFVFQAFSWAQYDVTDEAPFPTRAELDGMLCAAHTSGADWVIAYSWFDLADNDLPDKDVPGRADALQELRDVMIALYDDGWPVTELPMGLAPMEQPLPPVLAPNVYYE